jgi:hypothetical protein
MCVVLFLAVGTLLASAVRAPDTPIPADYFGLHIHHPDSSTPWPSVPFSGWRLSGTNWTDIEPEKGKWKFNRLDRFVELAQAHHVSILMGLLCTPAWASAHPTQPGDCGPGTASPPKDMKDWLDFVRTVSTRYKGRIRCYEIWNEPDSKGYWTASPQDMVELARQTYKTLKQVDPSITVVSPPITGSAGIDWLQEYLRAGGGKYADVIGSHFYVFPKPPEAMVPVIEQVKSLMQSNGVSNKPLWDTEAGWAWPKPFPSEDLGAGYLARAFVLNWAAGVRRFYWYSWDNHTWVSLQTTEKDSSTLKPAGRAYAEIEKWLLGAKMATCQSDAKANWVCPVNRDGDWKRIIWNANQEANFRLPKEWQVRRSVNLAGQESAVRSDVIRIGPSPQLIEK